MKTNLINRMCRSVILILILLTAGNLLAGGPSFKELNSVKLPFTPSTHWYTHTNDFKFFLCSTKTDMLMLDGITGKILWQTNFKKDYKNEKFANQYWNKEANVVLVFDEDTKKAVATKYFIDGKTGKVLWSSDKYVSDFGQYELSAGFSTYYDPLTNGVLLPTKESVDLVNVNNGKLIWSKNISLTGKAKEFDCYIMKYYDLVKVITGKENETYLTTADGKEVTDIEAYFNKKKFMADRLHATIIDIPEKNMYVLMQGETSNFYAFLGAALPKWKMNFKGYDAKTDKLLWNKQYKIAYAFDWIDLTPYIKMTYQDGKLFVEHDPNMNSTSGLTVLNPDNGEMLWEASYATSELKNNLTKGYLTPFPAPDPVIVNGKAFVVNKAKNIVSCYDANSGKKIWDSEKYPDAQKIPTLIYTDGVLVMGYGGDATKCVAISQSKGPSVYRHEYLNKDKYGIIAYDAATGKEKWTSESISKSAKDKFDFIAGIEFIDGKLYCSTDKNFFILEPKSGNVVNSVPVSKEKLGDAWKMMYFPKEKKIILNCENGVVKIDPVAVKSEGSVKTSTVPFYLASYQMNADDTYSDFAIFTDGNAETMKFKEFAAIDLDKMVIRGTEEGDLLFYDIPHFSYGAEMFYKVDGSEIKFYSVK
jgi:outer membrane protein assembly factor BamB